MGYNAVYQRDLLYPTDNVFEPGCFHLEMLTPVSSGRIPVIIESKTNHSLTGYLSAVMRVMQNDVFDRILVDVKNNVNLYIKVNEDIDTRYKGFKFILVRFKGEAPEYTGVGEIES